MLDSKAIFDSLSPILASHNYQLYDVKWSNIGHKKMLDVSVSDQNGYFDLDLAEKITPIISQHLDELLADDQEYILNVGSVGVERPIPKDKLNNYLEQPILVIDVFHNQHIGYLDKYENNELVLKIKNKTRFNYKTIPMSECLEIKTTIIF